MSSTARRQAPRPARPAARYWKGKAPKGAAELPSSEEEDEDEVQEVEEEGDVPLGGEQLINGMGEGEGEDDEDEDGTSRAKGKKVGKMSVALRDVNISKEGKVIVGGKDEVGRTALEVGMCSLRCAATFELLMVRFYST